ncbi:hypothetical protein NPIL_262951 [Nephila pilipes]|uniref:Uncharacterized protein n=1 Tax=Nephila pilipes TaxID=299642 RepID=A0A8X6R5Z3_NEPPI|nr:hypothetical protein NPIL_262951 [Nephila pilipes]
MRKGVFELVEFKIFKHKGLKRDLETKLSLFGTMLQLTFVQKSSATDLQVTNKKQRGWSRDLRTAFSGRPLSLLSLTPLPSLPTPTASALPAQQHTGYRLQCALAAESPNDISFSSEIFSTSHSAGEKRHREKNQKDYFSRCRLRISCPNFLEIVHFGIFFFKKKNENKPTDYRSLVSFSDPALRSLGG